MSIPRWIVAITGASGIVYGVRLLEALRDLGLEAHLVLTAAAEVTLRHESTLTATQITALATRSYDPRDLAAPIASGSYRTAGMLVAPCSIKTLSAIAHSYADTLVARAADVTLKEGRPLLLAVRETPLHLGQLRLLVQAAELGAVIFPPLPAFYQHPQTVAELVRESVGRMLARVGIENTLYREWTGG